MSEERRLESAPPYWRDNPFAQQCPSEIGTIQGALQRAGGFKSYLEIGCSFGWSMFLLAEVMVPGGKIRGIDFGYIDETSTDSETKGFDTKPFLEQKVKILQERGLDVEIFYGDSHSIEAIKWARDSGPYQFVGIDGDHSYEGVRADWENYGHLGEWVWFHDIANKELGVMQLWKDLQTKYNGHAAEIICPMGIGLISRLQVAQQTND